MQRFPRLIHIAFLLGLTSLLFLNLLPPYLAPTDSIPRAVDAINEKKYASPVSNLPFFSKNTSQLHTNKIPPQNTPIPNQAPTLDSVILIYGDYINESTQEPTTVWEKIFQALNYNVSTTHIENLFVPSGTSLLVVLPSVGTRNSTFGITLDQAQAIGNTGLPVLLLGYAHEVLDRLWGFDPITDFIVVSERFLWIPDTSLQIFNQPHTIPHSLGRLEIYADPVYYDAYRISHLPSDVDVLGTNFASSAAQLLWFRAYVNNSRLYYWGIDQAQNLKDNGYRFLENLIRWCLRFYLGDRLGETLRKWQLEGDYWAVQGSGGFGYPLEPSIPFTYYVTDLVLTYQLNLNLSTFSEWLLDFCYDSNSGYFEDLSSPQLKDRCITTSFAVLTLEAFSALNLIDQNLVSNYLLNCQDSVTGGFWNELGSTQTSLKATRYALEAIKVLGWLHTINSSRVIDFITTCQETDPVNPGYGGFYASSTGGLTTSLVSTLDALEALHILNKIDAINQTALLQFITACEETSDSGIFDTKTTFDRDEWILGTACALQVLNLTNGLFLFNIANSRTFLVTNQFANGGWGCGDSSHDFHNSPEETWYAVQGLNITGNLGSTTNGLIHYLANCCTEWGGATEPVIFGDFLTSWHIISALRQVGGLSAINQTALSLFLDNCWLTPLSSFSWHQLPNNVLADTDFPTPDRSIIEFGTFGPIYHYAFANMLHILDLDGSLWSTRANQLLTQIQNSQTLAPGYTGMFGLHQLYVGRETNLTFRFDGTCWSLLAYDLLGGDSSDLLSSIAALSYLQSCLFDNGTHQFFHDQTHLTPLPISWRFADGHLAETWLGLQAYFYLDPTLTGINGNQIATYASHYLNPASNIVSAFFATDIIYLLTEYDLISGPESFIDSESLKTLLSAYLQYTGLIDDPRVPVGRWVPYLTDLAFRLSNRLGILSYLDVNTILDLTLINYPNGTRSIGEPTLVTVAVNETRWGINPDNPTFITSIFNSTFTNFLGPDTHGYFHCHFDIPALSDALGPQNITIQVTAPYALPHTIQLSNVCEVWGNVTVLASYNPGHQVPRGVPLNLTIQVVLAENITSPLNNGIVTITNENTSVTYLATHQSNGYYNVIIPTIEFDPAFYILEINASVPYCLAYLTLDRIMVVVFDTFLQWEDLDPENAILLELVRASVRLQDENSTSLGHYPVVFNITRPGETQLWLTSTIITNSSGVAEFSWIPDLIGHWQISYAFAGEAQYCTSHNTTTIYVNRRPIQCTISVFPSLTMLVGNQSFININIKDGLNGTNLSNMLISLYEGDFLLEAVVTNTSGSAVIQWLVSNPPGSRNLSIEVAESSSYQRWLSENLTYHVMDSTSISIIQYVPSLHLGGKINLEVLIQTPSGIRPNGTASILWDDFWQHDFEVLQGIGRTYLHIPYTEVAGEHLLTIRFGHLESPDYYLDSSKSVTIEVLPALTTTLTLTITPHEITNPLITPRISVLVTLTYSDGGTIHGFVGNVTMQLLTQYGIILNEWVMTTAINGSYQLEFPTPLPGTYFLFITYQGSPGYAPSSNIQSLLIYPITSNFSPILILSLIILIFGLIGGLWFIKRLRHRANQLVGLFLPDLGSLPLSTEPQISEGQDETQPESEINQTNRSRELRGD